MLVYIFMYIVVSPNILKLKKKIYKTLKQQCMRKNQIIKRKNEKKKIRK